MIDHIGFGVSDIDKSKAFFVAALELLGYKITKEGEYGVGFGPAKRPTLWLAPANAAVAPIHVAFPAKTRGIVDAFYKAAPATGGTDNGAPGLRDQYYSNYYAAFVFSPDGHNIEAVCHASESGTA